MSKFLNICKGEKECAMKLKDKVAIVTGGGKGVGKAIAKAFAAEGAKVAVAATTLNRLEGAVEEIKEKGGEAIAVQTDLKDEKQVIRMVDEVVKVEVAGPEVILGAVTSSWALLVVKVDVAVLVELPAASDDEARK